MSSGTNNDIDIRILGSDDIPASAEVIATGMRDNPLHIAAFGKDPADREKKLRGLFEHVLPLVAEEGIFFGAFENDRLIAFVAAAKPGHCQPPNSRFMTLVPGIISVVGFRAFNRMGQWRTGWAKHDPSENHWHIGPVSIVPERQNQGIGTSLMQQFTEYLSEQQPIAMYLETDREENIPFFEKFGFKTRESDMILKVKNYYMLRPAGET